MSNTLDQLNELDSLGQDFAELNPYEIIDIDDIDEPDQDRKFFDQSSLESLAQNILDIGLIYTLVVKKGKKDGKYELVEGGRRKKALKMLVKQGHREFQRVSCKIIDGAKASLVMFSGNQHTERLNPVEIAFAIQTRYEDKSLNLKTQGDLAKYIRKHDSYVSRYLKILEMPNEVLKLGLAGILTSHQTLSKIAKLDKYKDACEAIISGMAVEVALKEFANPKEKKQTEPAIKISGSPLNILCDFLSKADLGEDEFHYKENDPAASLANFIKTLENKYNQ